MKTQGISSLWVGAGLLFALLIAAWSVMLFVASKHPTATVPLETAPALPGKTAGG
jgi:hypothetical protein